MAKRAPVALTALTARDGDPFAIASKRLTAEAELQALLDEAIEELRTGKAGKVPTPLRLQSSALFSAAAH